MVQVSLRSFAVSWNYYILTVVLFNLIMFINSILQDPNSTIVKVISYIPFTSPFVMIFRLTLAEEWIWWEIALSLTILSVSIWVCTKLAGKIFKAGIQKYGKNATLQDIWRWMWSS